MTVQAFIVFTPAQRVDVMALNNPPSAGIIPPVINNPLANSLGYGTLQTNGDSVAPARLLNDADYARFWDMCSVLPIYVMDSDTLFVPFVV